MSLFIFYKLIESCLIIGLLACIFFIVVNSGYPDQTPLYVVSDLGRHTLTLHPLTVYLIYTPFITFANREDPDQTALVRAV